MPTQLNRISTGTPSGPKILFWIWVVGLILAAPSFAGEDLPVNAPQFSIPSLDGHELALKDYQGKYLLVNFWATWCGPCKVEMPSLESLYRKFNKRNFAMIAVSNDIFGAQVVEPYIQAQNFTFPVGLDPKLKASNQFGVISLPTTFLIDPQGKIIGVLNGAENWVDPKTLLYFDQLLATPEKAAEAPQSSPCKNNQKSPC
jgi:peroxiredoxin